MFEGIDIVHLTGVFLAINPKNVNIAKRVMEIAKQKNIPVSFDPNIRLKLWSIEEARSVYYDIFPYVDILLTGLDEIRLIIGTDSKESLAEFAKVNAIDQLVIKDGKQGSKLYTKSEWHEKEAFPVIPVDTVGAGDGYDAGYIYGYLNGLSIDERLAFANGVGALVTTVAGDNEGLPYLDEVMPFIQNEIVIER
jgi:2-dehydro-3-deoxygluconokinase